MHAIIAAGEVRRVRLEARESEWEFVPGQKTKVWAYNGQVPGPTIEARVGDVLEVELVNSLSDSTSIHWHGVRLPAEMDGTELVQIGVRPGQSFTYRFELKDVGTFWYHPHHNESEQLERGLYGAILVRAANEPQLDRERVLVFDDVKLDRAGQIARIGGFVEHHDGRQGSTLLVNGTRTPEIEIAAGHMERWRIVNASSARYIRLSVGGQTFSLIGTDGGLIEQPLEVKELLLTPGDRGDIVVGPFDEGSVIRVESLKYDRRTIARSTVELIATLKVTPPSPSVAKLAGMLRQIAPLVGSDATPTREIHLGVRPSLKNGVTFVVNGEAHHRDRDVVAGELQVWEIVNDTLMDHPFHLHGFFFQVLTVNGKAPAFRSWEDTVNIPPRGRVKIAWMPEDHPGRWMYHCHILEHHASGMMGHFEIVTRD